MDSILTTFGTIAPYLTHPLVLVGFVIFLVFGIHRALIKAKIIQPLSQRSGSKVVQLLLRYGFVIALVVIVLGFGLRFVEIRAEAGAGSSGISARGDVSVIAGDGSTATLQTGNGSITRGPIANEDHTPPPASSPPDAEAPRPSGGSIAVRGTVSVEATEGGVSTLQTGSGTVSLSKEASQ